MTDQERDFRDRPLQNIPIPDPSAITTERLNQMAEQLRTEFDKALAGSQALLYSRIEVTERLLLSYHEAAERDAIALDKIRQERHANIANTLSAIDIRFAERDKLVEQDRIATAKALSASIQVVKEAATKSETSFTKEIDALKALIGATKDAIASDFKNVTSRIDRGEGTANGARQNVTDSHASVANILGIVGGIVGVMTLLVLVLFNIPGAHKVADQSSPSVSISPSAEYLGGKIEALQAQIRAQGQSRQ